MPRTVRVVYADWFAFRLQQGDSNSQADLVAKDYAHQMAYVGRWSGFVEGRFSENREVGLTELYPAINIEIEGFRND